MRIFTVAATQDPFYVELGKRIRDARTARGVTQDKLARALTLTRTSITNIEGGRQPVFAHHLVACARFLGVTVESLLAPGDVPSSPQLDARLRDLSIPDEKRDWVKRIVQPNS